MLYFSEKKRYTNNGSGYITLMSVLLVGAMGMAIATALILLGIGSSKTSLAIEQSTQARAAANFCAEEALQKIRESRAFIGSGNFTLPKGTCDYLVTNQGGQNRTVISSGLVGTTVRKVKITLDKITPVIHITFWQEMADF